MTDVYICLMVAILLTIFYITVYGLDFLICVVGLILIGLIIYIIYIVISTIRLYQKLPKIKSIKIIDLTETFGAGNEPSITELDKIFKNEE